MHGLQKWLQDKKIGAVVIPNRTSGPVLARLVQNGIIVYVSVPIFMGKSEWQKKKTLRPVDKTGRFIAPQGWYYGLNPHDPGLQKLRLQAVRAAAARPGVAGVFLDFIRYPVFWETKTPRLIESGFDPAGLRRFLTATAGLPNSLKNRAQAGDWAAVRRLIVNDGEIHRKFRLYKESIVRSFALRAAEIIREHGREIGIFFVPAAPFYDDGPALQNIVHQAADDLISLCDIGAPMLFHQMVGRPAEWLDEAHRFYQPRFGRKYRPVLQTYSVDTARLMKRIEQNRNQFGSILFHAEALKKKGY